MSAMGGKRPLEIAETPTRVQAMMRARKLRKALAFLGGVIAAATPAFALLAQEDQQVNPYEQLGTLVANTCTAGFRDARLEGELDTDWAQLKLICVNQRGERREENMPALAIAEMHDALDRIREAMARQSGARWKTFVFSLASGGRFSFDVEY